MKLTGDPGLDAALAELLELDPTAHRIIIGFSLVAWMEAHPMSDTSSAEDAELHRVYSQVVNDDDRRWHRLHAASWAATMAFATGAPKLVGALKALETIQMRHKATLPGTS